MWQEWVTATHMDELPFFLATTDKLTSRTSKADESALSKELQFSNDLVDTLASFAKTGDAPVGADFAILIHCDLLAADRCDLTVAVAAES
ncbi:hypothetical protein MRX96_027756 [Rhipicephalus microplus]